MLTEKDRPAFAEIYASFKALYPKTAINHYTVDLCFAALQEFDIEDIRQAAAAHVQHPEKGSFFPLPNDLIRIIRGSTSSRAALAWAKVERAMREVGPWRDVVFDDPLIHSVIYELGGWARLCETRETDLAMRTRTFERLYAELAGPTAACRAVPALRGIADTSLGAPRPQVFIGDKDAALAVHLAIAPPADQLASARPA